MESLIHFCRLCLQKFTGDFLLLNKNPTASGLIKHLFPGMIMDLVEKSKICTECFKNVQFAYTMRETVIKNEQKISSNLGSILATEENTCRFCLNTDISQVRVILYDSAYASMSVLEARCVIEIAIIDVSLDVFKKPVICNSCWQIVRLIYLFKKRCFATEKILKFYCTKKNLTSIPCKEIEYISTCFNSNLQKFSTGDKHDMGANLIPKDQIAHAQKQVPTSVVNIIRPIDVYLNNFTIEDEDDTYEEDIDDIFIESPRIVKQELSNPSIEDVKIEVEEHEVILEEQFKTLDGIRKEAMAAIREEVDDAFFPGDINNCLDTGGCKRKSEESSIKNTGIKIISAESMEIGIKERNSECGVETTVHASVEIIKDKSCGVKIGKKKLKKKSIKLKSVSEIEKNSAPVTKIQRNELENLDNIIKLPTLHNINNCNTHEKEEETIRHIDKKRKICLKNFEEQTDIENNSKNDQAETFETVSKIQRKWDSICKSKQKKSDNNNFSKDGHQEGTICGDTTNFKNSEDNHEEMLEHYLVKQQMNKVNAARYVNKNCNETVENRGEENHKSIVKNSRNHKIVDIKWSCNQCKYETKHKQHLTRHNLIHNKSPKILTCPKCIYSTYIQRNLDRHFMKHLAELFFHCAQCTYSTVYKSHLINHMEVHKNKKSVLRKESRSDEEVFRNKPFGFRCEDCPFMTSKEAQFVSHVRTHRSSEKIFKCEECHYITTRSHSLQFHMELHKKSGEKKFKCKYCSFTGRRHTDLVSHMVMHQKDFKFSCNECDYKAKRKSHLVTHILRHQRDKKKMFQCPYCKYKSIRKEHLQSHCRNRHFDKDDIALNKAKVAVESIDNGSAKESKVLKCPYCLYRQKIRSTLDVHIFTAHFPSKSEQMVCNHCSYQTDTRKLFMKHIEYCHHRKDKRPFMYCNDCLYKAKHKRLLSEHIKQNHRADRKK